MPVDGFSLISFYVISRIASVIANFLCLLNFLEHPSCSSSCVSARLLRELKHALAHVKDGQKPYGNICKKKRYTMASSDLQLTGACCSDWLRDHAAVHRQVHIFTTNHRKSLKITANHSLCELHRSISHDRCKLSRTLVPYIRPR